MLINFVIKSGAYRRRQAREIYSLVDEWTLGTHIVRHPSVGRILFEESNPRCGGNELPETARRWRTSLVLQLVIPVRFFA